MPISGFRVTGGTGPAPNVFWFGALADRLNLLAVQGSTSFVQADYGSSWGATAGTFGAFTTAPDGTTNTAKLFAEDGSTGTHFLTASLTNNPGGPTPVGQWRLGAFFKYAGRRVCVNIGDASDPVPRVQVVFDLANGVVGVAPVVLNQNAARPATRGGFYGTVNANILSVPNGFYLCSLDFNTTLVDAAQIFADLFLDNGTGTGAASTSYTGDGTSGVYVWRTNMLPAAAYTINNTVLFDDFTTLSTIDRSNTKAAGFNWYVNNTWTNYQTVTATSSGEFSISGGTNLSLPAISQSGLAGLFNVSAANGMVMGTAAQTGAGTYVGTGFKPPFYVEARISLPDWLTVSAFFQQKPIVYTLDLDWLSSQGTGSPLKHGVLHYVVKAPPGDSENIGYELAEQFTFINSGDTSLTTTTKTQVIAHDWLSPGLPTWNPGWGYTGGQNVYYSGAGWQSTGSTSAGVPPPTNFTSFVYPSSGRPNAPVVDVDYANFHTVGLMVLPYITPGGLGPTSNSSSGNAGGGLTIWFFNNTYMQAACYGPQEGFQDQYSGTVQLDPGTQGSLSHQSDAHSFGIFVGAGSTTSMLIDYIRVMQ